MNLKSKMYLLHFIGICLFVLIGLILLKSPFLILVEVAYIIILLVLRTSMYNKAAINIAKKFAADCDPDEYIKNINDTYYAKNKNSKFFKNLYTALGYSYKDDETKALDILKNTPTIAVSSYNEYLYHSILSRIYLENGNLEQGKKSFEILGKINLLNKKQQLSKKETLKIRKSQILYLENKFDESLEIENKIKPHSNLENVLKNYRLALIYLKLKNHKLAKQYLEFVKQNGNKLNIVNISNQKLEELKNEN